MMQWIGRPVGDRGANNKGDVLIVQNILNDNLSLLTRIGGNPGSFRILEVNGLADNKTITRIKDFQSRLLGMQNPNGRIDPDSRDLSILQAGVNVTLTLHKLYAIMQSATLPRVKKYYRSLINHMRFSGIDTPLRVAHFLAQIGHESADLLHSQELSRGDAYEGRLDLGNTQKGDGRRFKGRGLIQITGRANYEAFGKARGRDFTTEPNNEMIANIPDLAVDSACWFWTELKHRQHGSFVNLNELADHDDLHGITRVVNGGSNGILERYQHLSRAKCLLIPSMRLPAFMTARVDSWSFTKFSWK